MALNTQFEIFDIELFIAEIKKYPEIWNLSCESYHDRLKKRSARINICREFCEGFDEKEDTIKNEINNALVKKWRNVKDTYLKTLKKPKSRSGFNKGRQYLYARQLSFLRQTCLVPETESSLNSEQLVSDVDNEELTTETELECGQNNSTPNNSDSDSVSHKRPRKHDLESSLLAFMNAPIPSPTTKEIQANPNQSFFESLVPILNGFTEEEVIDFRMEVLSIIKRIQKARQRPIPTANPPNFDYMGYPPHSGTHNIIYSHQPPPKSTLTPTQSSQLPIGIATNNNQTFPPLHQNYLQLHESYYPLSQPSTSFKPASTNQLIPPQASYTTENPLQILSTHNTASIPAYSTQKLPNIQQSSGTRMSKSYSTKHMTTESHVRSPPSQDVDSNNASQYSVSPPLTSSSSVNEAEVVTDDECLILFNNQR